MSEAKRDRREGTVLLGKLEYVRGPGKAELVPWEAGPLTLGQVTLYEPEGLSRWSLGRRLRKLERLLRRAGVGRVLVPPDFPYPEWAGQWRGVDPLPFYRAIADMLALAGLESRGLDPRRASVCLSAPRLNREVQETAERLCPVVRGLSIDVPGDGADYAAWLHRQYGVPIRNAAGADVTAAFGPETRGGGLVLRLCEEQLELGGLTVTAPGLELPEGCEAQLLCLLWERGGLERERLVIQSRGRSARLSDRPAGSSGP